MTAALLSTTLMEQSECSALLPILDSTPLRDQDMLFKKKLTPTLAKAEEPSWMEQWLLPSMAPSLHTLLHPLPTSLDASSHPSLMAPRACNVQMELRGHSHLHFPLTQLKRRELERSSLSTETPMETTPSSTRMAQWPLTINMVRWSPTLCNLVSSLPQIPPPRTPMAQ